MKILVTGALGFIASHTILLLREAGHELSLVDRRAWIDITDMAKISNVFQNFKPDAVLHLAANSSLQKGIEDPIYDAQNNIIGTLNVLQAMKDNDCKRIVFASTSAVYDPFAPSPYTEETPTNPITPYGISKLACEYYIKASGLNHVILRYGNVFGPGQKPLGENILIARAISHMLDGEPFVINGDGEQIRDWIYVEDVALANLLALVNKNNLVGTLNISHGFGLSVNLILAYLREIIGYVGKFKYGPGIKGELRSVIMQRTAAYKCLGWLPRIVPYTGLVRTIEAWKKSKSSIPVS